MPSVDVIDRDGKVVGSAELPSELFEAKVSVPVMHQVVVAGLAALRSGTHSTKTRGEVRGGGKKPWRQKGTGRARAGSIRAPQWTGGGVAFGPTPRSHDLRVPKKMKRAALRSALTDALRSAKLKVVESLDFEAPKTREAVDLLESVAAEGRVLVVLPGPDEVVEKSFRNLGHVRVAYPGSLSTYAVLNADTVLLTRSAVDALSGRTTEESGSREAAAEPRSAEGSEEEQATP